LKRISLIKLELLTRPLIIVFRLGIEVDEALRVGGSGFLGGSNSGEVVCDSLYKNFDVDVQVIKW